MSDVPGVFDALDLHADVSQDFVSIHMDGDRDAEVMISGRIDGGERYDGEVYQFKLRGEQSGVKTAAAFAIPADVLEEAIGDE